MECNVGRSRLKLSSRLAIALVGFAAVGCPLALAHLWFDEKNVHFKGGNVDFGAPPTRYAVCDTSYDVGGELMWRPGTQYFYDREQGDEKDAPDPTHLYQKASSLESGGDYNDALKTWRWGWSHGVGEPAIERERIELLKILVRSPGLKGAGALLQSTAATKHQGQIPAIASLAPELRPFAVYRSIERSKVNEIEKAKRLIVLANDYPHSAMAEPALISVPRLLLAHGVSISNPKAVSISRIAIDDLASRYPRSRFRFDVVGWRGRIEYLAHRYAQAVALYRRQLALATSQLSKATVLDSLVLCEKRAGNLPAAAATLLDMYGSETEPSRRGAAYSVLYNTLGHIDGRQARSFWDRLRADPQLLAYYLDYRVETTVLTPDILALAAHGGSKSLHSRFGAHIYLRLAQTAYDLKKLVLAQNFATKSLQSTLSSSDRALATFLIASVEKKNGRFEDSRNEYESILRRFPNDYLCSGVRENLALIYEREGRFGDALDMYFKLGYSYDVAYLLDIRMAPRQIASYIDSHPRSQKLDVLHFSLGIRYLRGDSFRLAEHELERVPTKQRGRFRRVVYREEEDDKDVLADSIQDPLKTAHDLSRLYRSYRQAKSTEAQAAGLAKIADYYYDKRDLLLYNPALWHHMREFGIGVFWDSTVITKNENRILESYHWQHECNARCLTLCERILKKYPHASVRFRVAYRAGCAAEHLSNMNPYWRWQDGRRDIIGRAINLMSIAKHSPDKLLASAARKYVRVFAEDREMARQAFRDDLKFRRENPDSGSHQPDWSYD